MIKQSFYHRTIRNFFLLLLMTALPLSGYSRPNGDPRQRVRFETTAGTFVVALYDDTPIHRDNFLRLVRDGFYDGILFHRVIEGFMVQAGDPDSRNARPRQLLGEKSEGESLPAEIRYPGHYHLRGALAAARLGDDVNPERRSSGSQFYIVWGERMSTQELEAIFDYTSRFLPEGEELHSNVLTDYRLMGGSPHLDGQYTVFGEVVKGLKVIRKMQQVDTDRNDRPLTDIRILKATVVE